MSQYLIQFHVVPASAVHITDSSSLLTSALYPLSVCYFSLVCVWVFGITLEVTPSSSLCVIPVAGCANAPKQRLKLSSSWRMSWGRRSSSWQTSAWRRLAPPTTWTRSERPWTACRWDHTLRLNAGQVFADWPVGIYLCLTQVKAEKLAKLHICQEIMGVKNSLSNITFRLSLGLFAKHELFLCHQLCFPFLYLIERQVHLVVIQTGKPSLRLSSLFGLRCCVSPWRHWSLTATS